MGYVKYLTVLGPVIIMHVMAQPGRPMQTAPRSFDDSKLAMMVEPLSVRVDRIKGSSRTPIPMPTPEGEDAAPGTNWTKDDLRNIETWLVNEWSGGGLYEISVTDSSPQPVVMKWQPFWEIKQYPERVPPPLAQALAQSAPTTQQQITQPPTMQVQRPMSFPNGLPPGNFPTYAQPAAFQQQQPGYYPMPNPPPVGTPAWSQWQAEADKRKQEDELKTLREQNAQREREATEARHRAELDRIRTENDAKAAAQQRTVDTQLAEMRSMISGLTTSIKESANVRPTGPDPAIEALREQNKLLAQQAADEKREREAERRDAQLREMIKAQADESNRRMEMAQRQHEQTIATMQAQLAAAANSSNKPDQMLSFMQEQTRQHSEALKEIARSNQATIDRMQTSMMNPRDILMLAKESANGAEQATERVTNFFGKVVEMQQRVTENALQMQPGGSGVIDVVRDGVSSFKELAEKYVGAKSQSERFAYQAQAQVADAQARGIEAQAYAANVAANPRAPMPARVEALASSGLGGGTVTPITSARRKKKRKADRVAAAQGVAPTAAPGSTVKRLGKTDDEWFGPVLIEEVVGLREGVAHFVESLSVTPVRLDEKTKQPEGVSPEMACQGIVQAAQLVMQQGVQVPVMQELLFPERFADFVDVLLPDAPQSYRDDVVVGVIELLQKLTGQAATPKPRAGEEGAEGSDDEEDEEDEDDDEDDEDDDEDDEEELTAAPVKPVTAKPAK